MSEQPFQSWFFDDVERRYKCEAINHVRRCGRSGLRTVLVLSEGHTTYLNLGCFVKHYLGKRGYRGPFSFDPAMNTEPNFAAAAARLRDALEPRIPTSTADSSMAAAPATTEEEDLLSDAPPPVRVPLYGPFFPNAKQIAARYARTSPTAPRSGRTRSAPATPTASPPLQTAEEFVRKAAGLPADGPLSPSGAAAAARLAEHYRAIAAEFSALAIGTESAASSFGG